jgi:hypothetical protein
MVVPLLEACCKHDNATDHESSVAKGDGHNRKQSARWDTRQHSQLWHILLIERGGCDQREGVFSSQLEALASLAESFGDRGSLRATYLKREAMKYKAGNTA